MIVQSKLEGARNRRSIYAVGIWSALALQMLGGCGSTELSIDETIDRAGVLCDHQRGFEALVLLTRAEKNHSDVPQLHYLLGLAYEMQNELEAADKAYEKCLQLAPWHGGAMNNRGVVLVRLGRPQEAIAVLREATQGEPNDPLIWGNLGIAHQDLGQWEEAERYFQKSITLRPSAQGWFQLGNARLAQQQYTAALAAFDEAIQLDPQHAASHLQRGIVCKQLGDVAQAQESLMRAKQFDRDLDYAWTIHELRRQWDQESLAAATPPRP